VLQVLEGAAAEADAIEADSAAGVDDGAGEGVVEAGGDGGLGCA